MRKFKTAPSDMDQASFMQVFGGIYEHSGWVAEGAWQSGITADHNEIDVLATLMASIVAKADDQKKMDLILAHPDLAGKAAVNDELTISSRSEQASAGLNQCTAEEFAHFQEMNAAYKEKFEFPFIMAVKNSNRHQILAGFESRLDNSIAEEFSMALQQIDNIALFRLDEL